MSVSLGPGKHSWINIDSLGDFLVSEGMRSVIEVCTVHIAISPPCKLRRNTSFTFVALPFFPCHKSHHAPVIPWISGVLY